MRTAAVFLFAAALLVSGAQAKSFLTSKGFEPSQVLPPPPAAGSARANAEIDELKFIAAHRTDDEFAAAHTDAKEQTGAFFADVIGPGFDLAKLPATKTLLADVTDSEDAYTGPAKDFFARDRPWIVIPQLRGRTCTMVMPGPAKSSYPSGHTTNGYALAGVLAALLPARAQAILARADLYAEHRLVCSMHFRSDIVGGQALGTLVAQRLLADPDFRTEFDAARAELAAAHLSP
jgi:acid phosphatase (class A)